MPFQPGNKLSKGRPRGARNKEPEGRPLSPATAARFRSVLTNIVNDMGGEDMLSTAQTSLARRCAWLSIQCEMIEQREPFDLGAYALMVGHLARVLRVLGLKREPRDMTPTLKTYLDATREPASDEAE
jgi:hypothetical protein